jgi:hypothetical protein
VDRNNAIHGPYEISVSHLHEPASFDRIVIPTYGPIRCRTTPPIFGIIWDIMG